MIEGEKKKGGKEGGRDRERGAGKTFVDKSFPRPFQKTLTGEQ